MNNLNENNLEIRREFMKIASVNLPLASLAVLACIFIISLIFWEVLDKVTLSIWMILVITILSIRNIQAKAYLKNPDKTPIAKLEIKFKIYAIITACLISSSTIMILPYNEHLYQSFIYMILAGLSAGAVMSLSVYKNLTITYLTIILMPFVYYLFNQNTELHILVAFLVFMFLVMLIIFSHKYHENILDVLKSKIIIEQARKELQYSQNRFYTIFKQTPVGIFTYNKNLIIKESNQAFATLLHTSLESVVNLDLKHITEQDIRMTLEMVLKEQSGTYEGVYNTAIVEQEIWINMQTVPMYDKENKLQGGIAIVNDITKKVEADKKIHQQAFYDNLTGLANRVTLYKHIEHELARLSRQDFYAAILFIDIDHFKTINDSLGHHVGDEILKYFAKVTSSILRKEDILSRLGGDEFVILLSDLGNDQTKAKKAVKKTAQKLHKELKKMIKIENHSLYITLSIGVKLINSGEENVNDILKHADIAMYKAKNSGRNATYFFEKEMSSMIDHKLKLENEIHNALKLEEFELYFQAIVSTKDREVVSCEAFIRWNHPTKGIVDPDAFIPSLENSNLLISIGDWVIESSCQAYNKMKDKIPSISINISNKQFAQTDFVEKLTQATKKYEISTHRLNLELRESVALDDLEATIEKINILRALGYLIIIDNFGTGYSSLSHLKTLPFDFLKIDRCFISNLQEDEGNKLLVTSILKISEQFKFMVIAQGVETEKQVEFLKEQKCNYYQGNLLSKALKLEDFQALI